MVSARINVAPPSFVPRRFTLLDAVDWRDGDSHWQAGVQWDTICDGPLDSTYDECVQENAVNGTSEVVEPTVKSATSEKRTFGATPFTVFAEIDCSAVGLYPESEELVQQALERSASHAVERIFETGTLDVTVNLAMPHLAATVEVVDTSSVREIILQQATTSVTGAASCAQVALGLLESQFAQCHHGSGIVHVPSVLVPILAEAYLLVERDGALWTISGNRVVVGTGYTGNGPNGAATPGAAWMYMTPPIFGYRSNVRVFPRESTLDRSVNTVMAVAERNYLLGYDCCLYGIPVSLTCD